MPVEERRGVTFTADGEVIARSTDLTTTGTYEVGGDELTIVRADEDGVRHHETVGWRATEDRLVLGAFGPAGDGAQLVGAWTSVTTRDDATSIATLELQADFVARYDVEHVEPSRSDERWTGTWRSVSDDLVVVLTSSSVASRRLSFTRVAGVLGPAFERVTP